MHQFNPTQKESLILREWLNHLEMLDLLSGRFVHVFTDSAGSSTGDVRRKEPLHLSSSFVIGFYTIRESKSHDHGRPLINQVLTSIYERSWLNHMMSTINQPLPLDMDPAGYYNGITKTITDAAFARIAIMHLADPDAAITKGGELPITGIYDRHEILESFRGEMSFPHSRPLYRAFLDSDPVQGPEMLKLGGAYGNDEEIEPYVGDRDIKTLFVIRLALGGKWRGYLTIGFDVSIGLSDTLDVAFLNMGAHSLAATENYRQIKALDDLRTELMQKHLAGTQVELLQGFRHVAGGALGNATYAVEKIAASRESKTRGMDVHYADLEDALSTISDALAQMRNIRKVQVGLKEVDVFEVFAEAVAMTDYQLKKEKITVRIDRLGSMTIMAHEAALRYAFSNLLLNSVQAFQDGGQKQNRTITLVGRERQRDITLDFSDNGPGLRLGRGSIKSPNDIWRPGATSKTDGTGYGLPFVRDVIQRLHRGTININPSSSSRAMGLSFVVELPKKN